MNKEAVVIFGVGLYAKTKLNSIKEKYDVIGAIDSSVKDQEKKQTEEFDIIVNPKQLNRFGNVKIIIASVKMIEMWDILKKMSIDDERIIFGQNFMPAYDDLERILLTKGILLKCFDGKIKLTDNHIVATEKEFQCYIRQIYTEENKNVEYIKNLSVKPVSRRFGRECGSPIDRYYIDRFLESNSQYIVGDVFEVADDYYMNKYGADNIERHIMHVEGNGDNVKKINLETGEGVEESVADCIILTQTIQMIFNLDMVICNIYKMLKRGGAALITVHGISQLSLYDYRNWGEYWRLTDIAMSQLLEKYFQKEKIDIKTYGNVKIATAFLYGLCQEDLDENDFSYNDKQFPVIITATVKK